MLGMMEWLNATTGPIIVIVWIILVFGIFAWYERKHHNG